MTISLFDMGSQNNAGDNMSTCQISIMASSQVTQNAQLTHPQILRGSEKHWKK